MESDQSITPVGVNLGFNMIIIGSSSQSWRRWCNVDNNVTLIGIQGMKYQF